MLQAGTPNLTKAEPYLVGIAYSLSQSISSGTQKRTPDVDLELHLNLQCQSKLGSQGMKNDKPPFPLAENLNFMFLG